MKLPRVLAGLAGPSTADAQKLFLRHLKQAFRDRVEHRAPPLASSINAHLQDIVRPTIRQDMGGDVSPRYAQMPVGAAARESYIQGHLTKVMVSSLLVRSQSKEELDCVKLYAGKCGIDLVGQPTRLSACYAARLLHLGHVDEVKTMLERNKKEWILNQTAHPVMVQYACRTEAGIMGARRVFDALLKHDKRNLTTPLVRTLLRESVRADDLAQVQYCLALDSNSASGQETGLARWLYRRQARSLAFSILKRVEPARSKEGSLGLEIARACMASGEMEQARQVFDWAQSLYILSLQPGLRELQHALADTGHGPAAAAAAARDETLMLGRPLPPSP